MTRSSSNDARGYGLLRAKARVGSLPVELVARAARERLANQTRQKQPCRLAAQFGACFAENAAKNRVDAGMLRAGLNSPIPGGLTLWSNEHD